MNDPDGLSTEQRVLVNAAHQAIVVSAGLDAIARGAPDEVSYDIDEARSRSRMALQAADGAGVPRAVLDRTVRAAMAIGREHAGA